MFGEFGGCGDAGGKTVSVGIPARPSLASARARSRTFSRICRFAAICLSVAMVKTLGFAAGPFIRRTSAQAADFCSLLKACSSRGASLVMRRLLLSRSSAPKSPRYCTTQTSALSRRASAEAISRSMRSRSSADCLRASASMALSSSSNSRSRSAICFLTLGSENQSCANSSG